MIARVWQRAREAGIGPVFVAAADAVIRDAVAQAGGQSVSTDPSLASGSDRVHAALCQLDPERRYDLVVNLQGDLPAIEPRVIAAVLEPLVEAEISTLVAEIRDDRERDDPNVVKAAVALEPGRIGRALYFSRMAVPGGAGPLYHHIGVYGYRRAALDRFVALPQGLLERRERLEQLRALEHGMRIDAALVDTIPLGVDTPADLERARELLAPR
jgi:3-deoxy-manno-octulosonate cytidylyltransferase (CMP-KDO synthetase)